MVCRVDDTYQEDEYLLVRMVFDLARLARSELLIDLEDVVWCEMGSVRTVAAIRCVSLLHFYFNDRYLVLVVFSIYDSSLVCLLVCALLK